MSYFKDKLIIDFLCEVERITQKPDYKQSPIYSFVLGYISESYLKEPKKLPGLVTGLQTIQQYEEEFQAITESQRRKILINILIDPKCDIEQKMFEAMSDSIEESKEIDKPPVSKERQARCNQVYGECEDVLAEHLAFVEENERLESLDLLMWGFFCSHLVSKVSSKAVFEKILTVRQSQLSGLLNHNQKMRLYIKLYNNWSLDLNESLAKLLENPTLGSKPLSSLVVNEEKLSQIMAEQMALEEKFDLEKARAEQEMKDNEGVLCNICLVDLYDKDEDVFFMDTCSHSFHESCLTTYLHDQVKNSKFPILCPDEACKVEFATVDLKGLMTEESLEKYYEFTLNSFIKQHRKDISYCPTPGCSFAFFLNPDQTQFKCQVCSKSYCLQCRGVSHTGLCLENDFLKVARAMNYKACPHCKYWVERTEGCRHMVCSCGEEFCYDCGQDWKTDIGWGCNLAVDNRYYKTLLKGIIDFEPEDGYQANDSYYWKHKHQKQRAELPTYADRFSQISKKKLLKKQNKKRK